CATEIDSSSATSARVRKRAMAPVSHRAHRCRGTLWTASDDGTPVENASATSPERAPLAQAREGSAMTDDGVQRLRRPTWRDPRLGVGVLRVAASVALGSWAVARADRTTDVLVAVEALAPGDRLADAELRAQAVRPDG